jgi:hypothetical protein
MSAEVPRKEPSYILGKNIRSPSPETHGDGRPAYRMAEKSPYTQTIRTSDTI